MKDTQSPRRRRRSNAPWTSPVFAVVAVIGVGVWLGSARVNGLLVLPTLVSRARAGIQQLGTAVRNRFRITAAPVSAGEPRQSTTTNRRSQRPPRVVPFSKKP